MGTEEVGRMSNRVLNFIIGAKDMASSVFRRVGGVISGLVSKLFSLPTLIGGSAMAAAISKVVGASMQQDRAVRKLAASLRLVGDGAESTLRDLSNFAAALQSVSIYGDEAIMEAMALGMNLGVPRDRIKEVTRAAIGLAAATGMDLRTAMMLFGREASGAGAMLSRYGIVLEEGLSQQERMNRLIQIGTERFGLARAEAKGTAGAWAQLKNAIGDLWEKFGEGIDRAFNLEAIFQRLKGWVEGIDGEKIAASLSSAWNLVKSLFDGSVKWMDVLSGAGKLIGLSLKVGFIEAINFLFKALKGIVTGAAEAFTAWPKIIGETFKAYASASFWGGLVKVVIGSFGQLGAFLLGIFTAPIAALGAGLDKVWIEFSNAMAKTKLGRWAGFEEKEDRDFRSLYEEKKQKFAGFVAGSGSDSRKLIAEGWAQVRDPLKNIGGAYVEQGRRFADGFMGEMRGESIFDTSEDRSKIGDIVKSAKDGLSDLAKPSLLKDSLSRAAKDAQGVATGSGRSGSGLDDVRKKLDDAMATKVGRVDLGDLYDAARGQDVDAQRQIAENTRQMVELSRQLLTETKKGGIA